MSLPVGYYRSYYCDYYTYCSNYCCSDYGYCTYSSYCSSSSSSYSSSTYYAYTTASTLVGAIVGGIVGAQTLAALIFFLVWFFKRRTRLSKLRNLTSVTEMSYTGVPMRTEMTMTWEIWFIPKHFMRTLAVFDFIHTNVEFVTQSQLTLPLFLSKQAKQ